MTRDFAKKRRPAARRRQPKSQVPGWVWLFTGAVLGAFVSFLIYLADVPPAASTGCRQYAGGGSGARTRTSATLQTSLRFLQIIERKRGHRAGHRGRCPTARARTHDIDNRDSTPDIGRIHSTSGVFSAR